MIHEGIQGVVPSLFKPSMTSGFEKDPSLDPYKATIHCYEDKLWRITLALILINVSCVNKVHYLDDDYPDRTPRKYAQGIINVDGRYQQNLTMSPDGKEHLITETDAELWRYERILRIRVTEENKVVVDTPQFVKDFKYERLWFIGEPMISRDNKDLYFVADYPPDYWHAIRTSTGDWSSPVKMDSINTTGKDWFISVAKNKTLYFAQTYLPDPDNPSLVNGKIFKSPLVNGAHHSKIEIEAPFNLEDAGDPAISPNEDYLVFGSTREGGYGKADIYVAFKDKDGNWSDAYNVGNEINTVHWESGPYISPDEKYLFFSRRDSSGVNARFSDIYWVSIEVISKIRNDQYMKP
jgi:hypothetical protein